MYHKNIFYIFEKGAYTSQVPALVDKHFQTEKFVSYQKAIDEGHVVLTEIPVTDASFTHCVTVVGYHPDGSLIYMDTVTGGFQECSSSYPTGRLNIVITGFK